MTSTVAIYNKALAYIGQSVTVSDVSERSKEARYCTMFYEDCLDQMLSDFDWPFATAQVYLADIGSPLDPWLYRYGYPANCLKVQRLLSPGMQQVTVADERIPYQLGYGESGTVVHTNQREALMRYTVKVRDPNRLSALAVDALALLLASRIAMPIAAKPDLAGNALNLYSEAIGKARVHAFEQAQEQPWPAPEFVTVRG